jgi:anaerobic ribonucleoside-triphosphate reductase
MDCAALRQDVYHSQAKNFLPNEILMKGGLGSQNPEIFPSHSIKKKEKDEKANEKNISTKIAQTFSAPNFINMTSLRP